MVKEEVMLERIQNFLYSFYAKDIESARINELYDAVCNLLMQDIGKKWQENKKKIKEKQVYFLSFEYLPGKFLERNIRNLNIKKNLENILKKFSYTLDQLIDYEKEASLGSGQIGISSYHIINEFTNRKIRLLAYAMRYENGNMKQEIINNQQVESADYWLSNGNKWEHKKGFYENVKIYNKDFKAQAYDIPIVSDGLTFVNTLRLWKSKSVNNINFNEFSKGDFEKAYHDYIDAKSITQFLYVDNSSYDGKLLRLKQEYFYAVASINDIFRRYSKTKFNIKDINKKIKILTSDNHPALALIQFIKKLHDDYEFSYKKAIQYTREIFDHFAFLITDDSFETYEYNIIKEINEDFYYTILKVEEELLLENQEQKISDYQILSLDNINKYLSGIYYLESSSMAKFYSENSNYKIKNINIGFDKNFYVKYNNPKLISLLNKYEIYDLSKENISKVKKLKSNLDFINDLDKLKYENKITFSSDFNIKGINPYSIFDLQTSNIHEAKRQLLNALSIAQMYYEIKENTNLRFLPRTFIFAGKTNEGYFIAKEIIKFILALKQMIDKDKLVSNKLKIVFIEDISISKLKQFYPSVDICSNLTLPTYDNNGFELLASSYNFSNILTTRGGILYNGNNKSAYTFGDRIEVLDKLKKQNNYNAIEKYYSSYVIKYTVDSLINEKYSKFSYDFKIIYNYLITYNDSFNIFRDLEELIKIRKIIYRDYLDIELWTKKEIDNLAWANDINNSSLKILEDMRVYNG